MSAKHAERHTTRDSAHVIASFGAKRRAAEERETQRRERDENDEGDSLFQTQTMSHISDNNESRNVSCVFYRLSDSFQTIIKF